MVFAVLQSLTLLVVGWFLCNKPHSGLGLLGQTSMFTLGDQTALGQVYIGHVLFLFLIYLKYLSVYCNLFLPACTCMYLLPLSR